MTTRTRQAPSSPSIAVANGIEVGADRSTPFTWEDWFLHATVQQRAEALGLAQQQGLLYPQQLPPLKNGTKTTPSPGKDTPLSQIIPRLLGGRTDGLSHLPTQEISFFDADLDELQRQAVARALSTPDLVMMQGLPGTGKSRVLAEIIAQAARLGWRMLFLAGHPASIDVILQRFVDRTEVFPVRFLDSLEKPESLPAWLRACTIDDQKRTFLDRLLGSARTSQADAESRCRRRRDDESLWADLETLLSRRQDIDARRKAVDEALPGVAASIERAADGDKTDTVFGLKVADLKQASEQELGDLDAALQVDAAALAECDKALADLESQLHDREPAYLAKKHSHFWTLSYWLHLLDGSIIPETESLYTQKNELQTKRQQVAARVEELRQKQKDAKNQFQERREALIAAEIDARKRALSEQQQTLLVEANQVDAAWNALCTRLNVSVIEKSADAIAPARLAWEQRKRYEERQCQFANAWTTFVEETGAAMANKLPTYANLIAGTLMRWHTDAKFRDAIAEPVDLLIIEDAESLTEADLQKLSRHAGRCVLVGQALAEPTPAPTVVEKASRALLPAPLVSAACWSKLWKTLGGDAGDWPNSWRREGDRLVCQLVPLGMDDEQYLESEGLADAPNIELRILHRPTTRPCLAQVMFAPNMSFADAFRFMMREVQEFPLAPVGRSAWWTEDAQRISRHMSPTMQRVQTWIDLEPGLRLGAVADESGEALRIAVIEFDKSAGWDRAKAELWLIQHRPVVDQQRTVFLQTPYRFPSGVAKVVRSVIRCDDWLMPFGSLDSPALEFVAVPSGSGHDWPREGAGLELDLTATRYGDRLPANLRQGLPNRGFVNYLEAQALVRRLETWHLKEAQPTSRVAVLALCEGQVALLRQLIEMSNGLRARHFQMEIATPGRMHQRECDVVFLSLTRSHSHRAVGYCECASDLPLALTRARTRLLVFGDPGTLWKRTQWHGPLDHLDGNAAQQELAVLSRLAVLLQESNPVLASNGQANGRQSAVRDSAAGA